MSRGLIKETFAREPREADPVGKGTSSTSMGAATSLSGAEEESFWHWALALGAGHRVISLFLVIILHIWRLSISNWIKLTHARRVIVKVSNEIFYWHLNPMSSKLTRLIGGHYDLRPGIETGEIPGSAPFLGERSTLDEYRETSFRERL